jgi:hypothetical protein
MNKEEETKISKAKGRLLKNRDQQGQSENTL